MKSKFISLDRLSEFIKDGMTIHVGGFLGVGSPHKIIDKVLEMGVKDLTIVCNDTGFVDKGVGKWVAAKIVKKVVASHIGTNKETGNQMNAGETEVELVPQGTLAERVRAAGAGLGGVLTPTGLGTVVQDGKQIVVVDEKEYILEKPIWADVAILGATKADKKGNLWHEGSTKNFNPLMATAADVVIVEADEIVEVGEIAPENVSTPHIFVDYIIE